MRDYYKSLRQKFITSFIIAGSLLIFASCSPESYTQQDNSTKQKGEQTLYFTENEDGQTVHYEVNFNDGEISSLYKDGVKISENKIKDYEDLVYDNLESIRKDDDDFFIYNGPKVFHFDMDSLHENMKEIRKKLKAKNFHFKFDHKKFKEDMKKMKEELKDMDEIVIHIDKDKICKNLDKSLMHLNNLNFDFDFDLNEHEMNMNRLEEKMEDLKDEMDDLSLEMKDLDKEMKNLNSFLDAVKSELVKDNLIDSADEDLELELNSTEMKVNDKKVPADLFEKYKKMYEDHFNKKLTKGMKFRVK